MHARKLDHITLKSRLVTNLHQFYFMLLIHYVFTFFHLAKVVVCVYQCVTLLGELWWRFFLEVCVSLKVQFKQIGEDDGMV